MPKLIYSLGIANIGLANAKMICRHYSYDLDAMRKAKVEELSEIDGIGEVIGRAFAQYFEQEDNNQKLNDLLAEISIEKEEINESEQTLTGQAFVVTGSLEHFGSRNELKDLIERKGGKVTGSVTSKTVCLINNENDFIFLATQSGLIQYRDCTSLIALIWVAPPHTGQTAGISTLSLPVRFSAIWGIIIFAL